MRKIFWPGMIIMALVIGMTVSGCGDGAGGGAGDGDGFLGDTLNLSRQVWLGDWDYNYVTGEHNIVYDRFTGNGTISGAGYVMYDDVLHKEVFHEIGGSGSVNDGQLSFTIGTPSGLENAQEFFEYYFGEDYTNVRITPSNTRAIVLDRLILISAGKEFALYREIATDTVSEGVIYMYVDRDVAISGTGIKEIWGCNCEENNGYCACVECTCGGTETTHDFSINLYRGWNAIYGKRTSYMGSSDETTLKLGNPSHLRWIMHED